MFTLVWRQAFGVTLAPFQIWLLRRIMERYPRDHPTRGGQLRYRQVLISVARQNGKSDIAAILGLWGLLRKTASLTIGIASSADLASIVYKRALLAINSNPELQALFDRATRTRGIEGRNGSLYQIKASKSAALQGQAIHTGIVDEVHLVSPELWADMVNGTGARLNTLVVGITTAGSTDSDLLNNLYETGRRAAAGDEQLERFGFFLWESPEARVPEDDAELLELLLPANPLLASGVLDTDTFISDVRGQQGGEASIVRYRLNRFIESEDTFVPLSQWGRCQATPEDVWPTGPVVFTVDRAGTWDWATVTASTKDTDGVIHTRVVASFSHVDLDKLLRVCKALARFNSSSTFAMDNRSLKELALELRRQGYTVRLISLPDILNATSTFLAKVAQKKVRHAGNPIVSAQMVDARRKDYDGGFKIRAGETSAGIDAVVATVNGVYVAEIWEAPALQLFV